MFYEKILLLFWTLALPVLVFCLHMLQNALVMGIISVTFGLMGKSMSRRWSPRIKLDKSRLYDNCLSGICRFTQKVLAASL